MQSRDAVYLTKEEVNKLAGSISNNRDRILFETLYETGCTLKELTLIQKKDFDFKHSTLTIPAKNTKNNKSRKNNLSDRIVKKIFLHLKKNRPKNFIFESRQSGRITERRVQQLIANYSIKSLSIRISPHDLRTTRIIHSFLDQTPIDNIEKSVGINNIQPYLYTYFKKQK
ncbi:tyrosine-type recombinase/integrase [Bacteroidota bacterium]